LWFGFADYTESTIAQGGDLEAIKGLANKLPEHAARIAAVVTLVRDIYAGDIAPDDMAAGIMLAQHYAAEALRLDGASGISDGLRRTKQLLEWLLTHWNEERYLFPTFINAVPMRSVTPPPPRAR
jgi:Protein of unknown function (DUF3987)